MNLDKKPTKNIETDVIEEALKRNPNHLDLRQLSCLSRYIKLNKKEIAEITDAYEESMASKRQQWLLTLH